MRIRYYILLLFLCVGLQPRSIGPRYREIPSRRIHHHVRHPDGLLRADCIRSVAMLYGLCACIADASSVATHPRASDTGLSTRPTFRRHKFFAACVLMPVSGVGTSSLPIVSRLGRNDPLDPKPLRANSSLTVHCGSIIPPAPCIGDASSGRSHGTHLWLICVVWHSPELVSSPS